MTDREHRWPRLRRSMELPVHDDGYACKEQSQLAHSKGFWGLLSIINKRVHEARSGWSLRQISNRDTEARL